MNQALIAPSERDAGAAPGGWLPALRAQAMERVGVLKWPTSHDEEWRFTDVSRLGLGAFPPARPPAALALGEIERFAIDEAAARLVFVDGVHAAELSSVLANRPSLTVTDLASAVATHGSAVQAHLGRHTEFNDDVFAALNTAFLRDAAVVIVPRDVAAAGPVHLLFITTQVEASSHSRLLVLAEGGSEVTLIEDHVALQEAHEGAYFSSTVAEIVLLAQAQVKHIRLQRESPHAVHIGRAAVSLARSSQYHVVNVALGGRLSRLDLTVRLAGDAAACSLDGLALVGDGQLADTHTFVDHACPHGVSRQLHKTIVGGDGRAVFNGRVVVRHGAQQTDSAQSSRNLLLASTAQVNTLPQLEIHADDVKCVHGATVGQLDADEVFYLQSRGLSPAVARGLLTSAFGAEVIDRINVPSLRRRLTQAVLDYTRRGAR